MAQARGESTWKEEGALPGAVVIRLHGINQDEQDKLDLENFARGLSAPEKEDPGGKQFSGGRRAMTPREAVRLALAVFLAVVTYLLLSSTAIDPNLGVGLTIGAFVLGFALPSVVRLVAARRAAPVDRITSGVFELRFDAGQFSCSGAGTIELRFELARVRSFTGGRRLSVELTDAPAATLPLSVPSKNNSPLATRLNDLLAASRASSSRAW